MKKRILSALLVLCLACGLVSTAWATGQSTPETAAVSVTDAASGETAQEEPLPDETAGEPSSDETVEGTAAPVADGTEYTAALESDGQTLNVIVTAPDGAFAEGVEPQLSVTMLSDEDKLDAVASELDNAQVQYDGFTALDITFTDKITGEEIEPAQQVSVRIELPQAIVDSGIDLSTLAVQHLEEDADGNVQNVTEVATLDNGITLSEEAAAAVNEAAGVAPMSDLPAEEATAGDATETPAAVAEFSVDGFSSFVITWRGPENVNAFEITFKYVDENGNEIDAPNVPQKTTIERNQNFTRIEFSDYIREIEGYTYKEARYQNWKDMGDENNGGIATYLTVTRTQTSGMFGTTYYTYTLNVYNEDDQLNTPENVWTWGGLRRPQKKGRTIYLIYTKDETTTPGGGDQGDTGTVTENATVTTSKTAVLKTDNSGNYDLTLSISGDRGNKTKKQAVDVLFIVDRSGSMTTTRQNALDSAVETLITTLQSDRYKDNIDAQYGVVAFAGSKPYNGGNYYDYGTTSYNWTSDGNATLQWIKNLNFEGGTNYQQAIYTGKEMLENRSNDRKQNATTFVIFISDGIPTYRGVDVKNHLNDSRNGNGSNDNDGKNIGAAKTEIANMTCDYFYAIGMGDDFGQKWTGGPYGQWVDKQGTTNLKALANAVNADYAGDENVYSADDEDLSDAFGDITATITFFAATDVTITDPLSQYADIVPNADGAAEFTVTVTRTELTDEDGAVTGPAKTWEVKVTAGNGVKFQNRAGNDVTVIPAYDANTKTITLTFPHSIGETPGYELEPGYTYSISTVIAPSDKAKQDYADNKVYPETPDDNTGTHSIPDADNNNGKDKGFWSNDNANAKVTFTANGEDGSQAFPKPVIQVTESTGSLKIVKDVQGIDNTDSSSVANTTFTFQIEKVELDENDNYVTDTEFNDDDLGFVGGVKSGVTIQGESETVIRELPEGTYRVTETAPPAINANKYNGPTVSYTVNGSSTQIVTITKDNIAEIQVTNTYSVKTFSLTVEKNVTGNLGDTNQDFTFTVTGINAGEYSGTQTEINPDTKEEVKTPITVQVTDVNGKLQFKLKDGQSVTFESLPYGTQCSVVEDEVTGYEQNANCVGSGVANGRIYTCNNEGLTAGTTVTFTNHKELVGPPTGLERNDTPYTILVTVAGIAGLALIGGIVARRRRRRME